MIRDILEGLYFITGGPIIAYLVWRGLSQIKVATTQLDVSVKQLDAFVRQTMATEEQAQSVKIQNERDVLKSTMEQCGFLKDSIIPEYNNLIGLGVEKTGKSLIPHLQKTTVDIGTDGLLHLNVNGCPEENIQKEHEANQSQINEICNNCEMFAMYFTKHVADENVAFSPCAKSFCEIVDTFAIYIHDRHETAGIFSNLWELYTRWKRIIKSNEIAVENIKNKRLQQNLGVPKWTVKK